MAWLDVPILIPIHNGREPGMYVCARTDYQEDDEEEGLEVEEGGLLYLGVGVSLPSSSSFWFRTGGLSYHAGFDLCTELELSLCDREKDSSAGVKTELI